ncbi:dihydrofolate reductase [Erythrobacter aureus]|nr:dihydrofolate reductase [Erythrobacter aureus]
MTGLTSIVAVGLDGAIGIENRLPWSLKSDLRFFKQTTKGGVVLMGRKTYDSLGSCLPHRENIVLSHTPSLFPPHEGCHHVHSISEALALRTRWRTKHAYVIGGAQTYAQFAPFVDRYLITIVQAKFPDADAFFDQSILGDESLWARKELEVERVVAQGADEFEFQVFELRHKEAMDVAARRNALVSEHQERNHLHKPKRPLARGRSTTESGELRLFA